MDKSHACTSALPSAPRVGSQYRNCSKGLWRVEKSMRKLFGIWSNRRWSTLSASHHLTSWKCSNLESSRTQRTCLAQTVPGLHQCYRPSSQAFQSQTSLMPSLDIDIAGAFPGSSKQPLKVFHSPLPTGAVPHRQLLLPTTYLCPNDTLSTSNK